MGLSRLERYVKRINKGLISRHHELTEVKRINNNVLFNGNIFGQISAVESMTEAIRLCKKNSSALLLLVILTISVLQDNYS